MMRQARQSLVVLLGLTLLGCAALTPRSFDQGLAIGYATQTAVLDAAKGALVRKEITKDDAERILAISDEAGKALDAARVAKGTDIAESQLELASRILDQLSAYLTERGKM